MGEKIIENIWVKKSFFDKSYTGSLYSVHLSDSLDPAYTIWDEANKTILASDGNVEKLNQGFLSLKRAFNATSKMITKYLGLDQIEYTGKAKKKDFLATLEHFEIMKTLTLGKYLSIRNYIEHENISPPSKEECLYFSEYIWSYIRNTSYILNNFSDEVSFKAKDPRDGGLLFNYEVECQNNVFKPHLYVTACLYLDYISFAEDDNSIEINDIDFMSTEELKQNDFLVREFYSEQLNHVIFRGEIQNQDKLAAYVKYLLLPEYGGIDVQSIQEIF